MNTPNQQEPIAVPMNELPGKRGFIVQDGKTLTVTIIAVGDEMVDRQTDTEVEVIASNGERMVVEYAEITFEEPADEPETPAPAAPVAPTAEAPRAMTIRDTEVSTILDPNTYIQMKALAKDFFDSKVVPSSYQNMLQVLFGIQAGYEMGMQPVEALQSITFVNGNASVWGKAVPRRLRVHGWSLAFEEGQDDANDELTQFCEATIIKGDQMYTDKIYYRDAVDSGYTTDSNNRIKPGWKPGLNRKLKLRYDVLDVLCKTYVPEVFGGTAGTAEVLADVNIIEGEEVKPTTVKDKIKAATAKLDTKAKVNTETTE